MRDKPRFVFDANLVVSALLFEESTPGKAFYLALSIGDLLVSDEVVFELVDVLTRPKFDRYVTREERELFLQELLERATLVEISTPIRACRDHKDDKYLSLAVSGCASHIITGDSDLLVLDPFRGIAILTAANFIQLHIPPA